MFKFVFKVSAAREIDKLSSPLRQRILKKLKFYSAQENPLRFAEKLTDYKFGEYRFRMGDYRILFDAQGKEIIILKAGHRKDVYK